MPAAPTPAPEQQPETYFNFTGMKATGAFERLPALGDRMEFRIVAECNVEPHLKKMTDGHRRPIVGMKVLDVEAGEITPAPDDPQLSLVDDVEQPFASGDE